MVSPKGTLRQQQTISIAPGPLLSLFLMGWQNPAPQSHLWIQDWRHRGPGYRHQDALVIQSSGRQEQANPLTPSKHQKLEALQNHFETPKMFSTGFETGVSELCLMGSVARQFPSLTRTIGMQRGKYCPGSISLPSHSCCPSGAWLCTAMAMPAHPWGGLHLGGIRVEDFILNLS